MTDGWEHNMETIISSTDFALEQGLTHGVVGPNGIGKTTLLRKIAGQQQPAGLLVFGQKPFDNRQVMDRTILMGIDNPLIDGWNIKKLMRLGQARWSTWNTERAEELQERFELPSKNYSSLSRGQKSAMGIILAVASGCELMLLDEPYLGLDVHKRQVFYDVLREEHGRTIVISTHHLNELAGHLDTVLMLNGMRHGEVAELIDGILEISGHPENLDRLLNRLQLSALKWESGSLGDKAIVDAMDLGADHVFDAAGDLGVRVNEVSLEKAILALGEEGLG